MPNDTTPEGAKDKALRLAHALDGGKLIDDSTEWADTLHASAVELRRLHARVQELERELSSIGAGGVEPLRQSGARWLPVAERLPEPGTPVLLDIGKRRSDDPKASLMRAFFVFEP